MKTKLLGLILCLFMVAPASAGIFNPTDLDGDGLYEDLNGNGILDFDDVVLFCDNLETLAPEKFDFNGNGIVDFVDIITLYYRL